MISKPMQIYNADETGICVVHKPGKVICEVSLVPRSQFFF